MTKPRSNSEFNKFRRYRESRKAQGMKLLRMWIADPRTPAFQRKAKRQAVLLRGAPEESEALSFIERSMDRADWTA